MENPRPVLITILVFIALFGGLTISVIVREGLDPLTVISIVILGMFAFGIVGAIRQPPE